MKTKFFKIATTLAFFPIVLTGCSTNNSASNQKDSEVKTTVKEASGLWNNEKDKKLNDFIKDWEVTMNQSYTKYDGENGLKTSTGMVYPDDLSKVKVENSSDSIGWSKNGKGNHDYNFVAIYNCDGDQPPMPNHITYFFAFHDKSPVVLVDQSRDGTPVLTETKNIQLKNDFGRIANNRPVEKVSSNDTTQANSSSDSNSSTNKTPSKSTKSDAITHDPKKIGVMMRLKYMPGDDLDAEENLGVYKHSGIYWIGIGTSVSNIGFGISGNNAIYYKKDLSGGRAEYQATYIPHTLPIKQLQDEYYSTPEQKQLVDRVSNRMPSISDEDQRQLPTSFT